MVIFQLVISRNCAVCLFPTYAHYDFLFGDKLLLRSCFIAFLWWCGRNLIMLLKSLKNLQLFICSSVDQSSPWLGMYRGHHWFLKRLEPPTAQLATWHLVIQNFHARSCFNYSREWAQMHERLTLLLHTRHSMFCEEMVLTYRWSHKGHPRYPSLFTLQQKSSFYAHSKECNNDE